MKLTPKLVHARLTGCRDYGLHGCFTFLDINSMYIHIYSHRWPRRGSFDILRQTHDSSDNTGDPYITDCHLFLAIFFLLSSISATNPMRFLLLSLSIYIFARCFLLLFQIQIREIARRIVTLRLENWPFGYRFEMPNSMDAAEEMITLHLGCAKGVNKNEARPSRRKWRKGNEMEGERKREREILAYLIVESLPGLDLQ